MPDNGSTFWLRELTATQERVFWDELSLPLITLQCAGSMINITGQTNKTPFLQLSLTLSHVHYRCGQVRPSVTILWTVLQMTDPLHLQKYAWSSPASLQVTNKPSAVWYSIGPCNQWRTLGLFHFHVSNPNQQQQNYLLIAVGCGVSIPPPRLC